MFPPVELIQPTLDRVHREGLSLILVAPCWHPDFAVFSTGSVVSMDLLSERDNLMASGLPINIMATIQSAKAASTLWLYALKWRVFEAWCRRRFLSEPDCGDTDFIAVIVRGRSLPFHVKVYLMAISTKVMPGPYSALVRVACSVKRLY